jgi:hypothetical protein
MQRRRPTATVTSGSSGAPASTSPSLQSGSDRSAAAVGEEGIQAEKGAQAGDSTTPVNSTVTMTATAGSLQQTVSLTLTTD